MVVEDEPDIYDVLLAMFEVWGIEGIAFVDGAEAVAWIEDVDKGNIVGELPELAILDIRLPEISGPEVGGRIRKSTRLGSISVVLITAYRLTPSEEDEFKNMAQADALMYKPLPIMTELRTILDDIIENRRRKIVAGMLPGKAPETAVTPLPSVSTGSVAATPPAAPAAPATTPAVAATPAVTPTPVPKTQPLVPQPKPETPPSTPPPAQP
jgi:CheY-like chemotaxis protein